MTEALLLSREVQDELEESFEESLEESSVEELHKELTCGVEKCPRSKTIWPTKERLEEHR